MDIHVLFLPLGYFPLFISKHVLICPPKCYCDSTKVQCNYQNLLNFPNLNSIPGDAKWLDLNTNRIEILALAYKPTTSFPKATHLSLDYNELKELPTKQDSVLSVFSMLQYLSLSSNKINNFATDAFVGLRHLKELSLSKNKIHAVPDGSFRELVQLKVLRLQENEIQTLTKYAFTGLFFCVLTVYCFKIKRRNKD